MRIFFINACENSIRNVGEEIKATVDPPGCRVVSCKGAIRTEEKKAVRQNHCAAEHSSCTRASRLRFVVLGPVEPQKHPQHGCWEWQNGQDQQLGWALLWEEIKRDRGSRARHDQRFNKSANHMTICSCDQWALVIFVAVSVFSPTLHAGIPPPVLVHMLRAY